MHTNCEFIPNGPFFLKMERRASGIEFLCLLTAQRSFTVTIPYLKWMNANATIANALVGVCASIQMYVCRYAIQWKWIWFNLWCVLSAALFPNKFDLSSDAINLTWRLLKGAKHDHLTSVTNDSKFLIFYMEIVFGARPFLFNEIKRSISVAGLNSWRKFRSTFSVLIRVDEIPFTGNN